MKRYNRIELAEQSKELGFVRDTYEKVCRLTDILDFIESDLSDSLVLKGGTAINLTIFDLPRLSVDIDLDYNNNVSREDMLSNRKRIDDHIKRFMTDSGYTLKPKSKHYYALDSYVYEYINSGGVRDNIKIEINYMLRCHLLPAEHRPIVLPGSTMNVQVSIVNPIEIFAAKTVALLNRSAPRDLYDISNMIKYGIVDVSQEELFRKCVIFYSAIASDKPIDLFNCDVIDNISNHKVKTDLIPVISRDEHFNLDEAKLQVENYLSRILTPDSDDLSFLEEFSQGNYAPELLFDDEETLTQIKNHPMAIWKCSSRL